MCNKRQLISLLLNLTFCSFTYAATPVVLTTHNLFPYGAFPDNAAKSLIADNSFTGTAVDRVRCAFDKLNRPLVINVMPWKRAQKMVQLKQADGFFAASQNQQRDSYATLSSKIAEQAWTWYQHKESRLDPKSPTFKQRANIASFRGANMHIWLTNNHYKIAVTTSDPYKLLDALLNKRVDAVLANNQMMDMLLKKHNMEFKKTKHSDRPLGVYFAHHFLAQEPKFLSQFNQAIAKCRYQESK